MASATQERLKHLLAAYCRPEKVSGGMSSVLGNIVLGHAEEHLLKRKCYWILLLYATDPITIAQDYVAVFEQARLGQKNVNKHIIF